MVIRDPIFVSGNYRDLSARRGRVTGDPTEPSTKALTSAGAVRVARRPPQRAPCGPCLIIHAYIFDIY